MKRLILATCVIVAGCASTPKPSVIPAWPDVPADLQAPAKPLTPLTSDQRSLSDLLENANTNYAEYYVLKEKYEAWQQWYNSQKQIWNGLK